MTEPNRAKVRRTKHKHRPESLVGKLLALGFVSLIFLMPLMLGTTTTRVWPMLFSRVTIALLFVIFIVSTLIERRTVRASSIWLILLFGAIATLFQLLPLPAALLAFLSPAANDLYLTTLESLGLYGQGQMFPLSLDPVETGYALSGFFSLLMVYLLAANVFSSRKMMKRIFQGIAMAGFLVAVIGFLQKALGMSKIFGFIPIPPTPPFFFSSFINPNNLAAFLGMCVPLQIALALKQKENQVRLFYFFSAAITGTALFLSLSRGGIIAFVFGLIIFAILLGKREDGRKNIIVLQVMLSAVLLLASGLAMHELATEFGGDGSEAMEKMVKPRIWEDAANIVTDFPITGIGVESFKVVFPIYKTVLSDLKFVYPENLILRILSESGLLVGLAVIFSFLMVLWRIFRLKHIGRLEAAGFTSLVILLVHNSIDFNLSIFAIAVPFMTITGIIANRTSRRSNSIWLKSIRLKRSALLLFTVGAIAIMIAGEAYWIQHRLENSQRRLHQAAHDRSLDDSRFEQVLAAELTRHPADYYLHLLASEHYQAGSRSDLLNKLFHLKKAQVLNPTDPRIDRLIGRAYARIGDRIRAREAYRRSFEKFLPLASLDKIWSEMLKEGLSPDDLTETIKAPEHRIVELARFLERKKLLTRARGLLETAIIDGRAPSPQSSHVLGQLFLKGKKDTEKARALAERLVDKHPTAPEGYDLLGRIAHLEGKLEKTFEWFEKANALESDNFDRNCMIVGVLMDLGRYLQADERLQDVHRQALKDAHKRARAYLYSGRLLELQKKPTEARAEYERALIHIPDFPLALVAIGKTFEIQGNTDQALQYYHKARRAGADWSDLILRIKRLEKEKEGK